MTSLEEILDKTAACAVSVLAEMDAQHPAVPFAALPPDYARRLRACIREYVVALRRTGIHPEQVVTNAKQLVTTRFRPGDVYSSRLTSDVVMWALEAYYGLTAHGPP